MDDSLKGKKVLLIATAFFGYELKMKRSIEKMGAEVHFFDERSINKSWEKALIKISPGIFRRRTLKYYEQIIENCKNISFDYLYVYGATMIDRHILEIISSKVEITKKILYLADSKIGDRRYEEMYSFFDKVVTFDKGDYQYYKDKVDNISFLPLFYSDEYICDDNYTDIEYDISFVGTIHTDRMRFLNKIRKEAEKLGLKVMYYCYLPGKFMYFYYWIIDKEFRKMNINDFKYKKISANEIKKIMEKSYCILDAQYPKNRGLTMRTIETLGMKRKLITANNDIIDYNFYRENNIMLVERNEPHITKAFFESPYEQIDEEIYCQYHIDQWIKSLFS